MMPPVPKAVIFDWDDTLVDTWLPALEARNAALVAMGEKPWSDEEARRRAGQSGRDLFRQMFGEARGREAEKIYYEHFHRIVLDKIRVHNDVEDILELLQEKKIYQAVVSNKRGDMLRKEAGHLGFKDYFGAIVGAGDAPADKPDPAPVFMALAGSGVEPGPHVWFVGDSHVDLICALNAGCTPILLETKPPPEELLFKNPPAKRFKTHGDLMEFFTHCFT